MKNYLLCWTQKNKNKNIIAHGNAIIEGGTLWTRGLDGKDYYHGEIIVEDAVYTYVCVQCNALPEVQPAEWSKRENAYEDGVQEGWYVDLSDGSQLLLRVFGYENGVITKNLFN